MTIATSTRSTIGSQLDRAVAGAGGAPLSNEQKKRLVMLARRAFAAVSAKLGAAADPLAFDAWRRMEQWKAVGTYHLTATTNADYAALKAHFLALLGAHGAAEKLLVEHKTQSRAWAAKKLEGECNAARDVIAQPFAYVWAIAQTRYKAARIEDLSPRQLWGLVFDIRRAAQRRRKRIAIGG